MKVLHISSECYPAAKAGGMGDVVGALPVYLPAQGIEASVVIPKYKNKWFAAQSFSTVAKGKFKLSEETIKYTVEQLDNNELDYPFYCIDIPGKFDRESIYLAENGHGYPDEPQRNVSFQIAVVEWLKRHKESFDVLHCHDHMTGLITFFIKHCPAYKKLKDIPTCLTIHNGQYRGIFDWEIANLFPDYDEKYNGLLDWDGQINSLATAIKCAWKVATVSPSYMDELLEDFDTLTSLIRHRKAETHGILNGIDEQLWNPASDEHLTTHLKDKRWAAFKSTQKKSLLKRYGLKSKRPLISFIGRFAHQKGADLLVASIATLLQQKRPLSIIILGSGDKSIEEEIKNLAAQYPKEVAAIIAYDEGLARALYAGSDFMIMPSRFEPCGLNQLYAMRYGTIPVVRAVGGLKDTVPDISDGGNGIAFQDANPTDVSHALNRAIDLYKNKKQFNALRKKVTTLNYSWHESAKKYSELYESMIVKLNE